MTDSLPPTPGHSSHCGLPGRAIVVGFAAAVAVWSAWFITHLPWIGMAESTSIPLLLGVWVIATAAAIGWVGDPRRVPIGLLSGVVGGLVGLLILGSKIVPDATPEGPVGAPGNSALPPVWLIVPGFVALGALLGLVGGFASALLPRERAGSDSLSRFGIVVSVGIVPLLVVGGLVTSTDSGMAVPDWPNTYGSNMFLYPLGPRSDAATYLEHSHRLFGSLIGLMTVVLAAWVWIVDRRRWVCVLAGVALALVIVQGVIGGGRVLMGSTDAASDNRAMAMLHGVLAQVVFGVIVALAAALSPLFKSALRVPPNRAHRRFKAFATGFTHALILQLVFGAMYRHMRSGHALWTHAGFSLVIVLLALLAGFAAMALTRPAEEGQPAPLGNEPGAVDLACTLGRIGWGMVIVVGLQFALGWAAFFVGGEHRTAASPLEALIRTAHQANGAALVALAALGFVWSRWILRRATA
ncbi:MAG: COX15/CtaA family protein [Phycisphaeraceae bacterium]|nr:COX15/CtaA family protein [Phycisphaeraceae bacterium]